MAVVQTSLALAVANGSRRTEQNGWSLPQLSAETTFFEKFSREKLTKKLIGKEGKKDKTANVR